jgi:hypothetical protein
MKRLSVVVGMAICSCVVSARVMADESQDQNAKVQRIIPLSEIVTTSSQTELRSLRDTWEKDINKPSTAFDTFMRQIQNINNGGSNVFIVDATNLYGALSASSNILIGSRRADTPAPVDTADPERGSHWLVAYLGSGPSNPTWWTVESVEVDKGKVVLSYRESKPRPATDDMRRYYYWVSLGRLTPGAYEVQLFDVEKGAATLMRRVEVSSTAQRGRKR